MIIELKQREENNNIIRNSSKSDILTFNNRRIWGEIGQYFWGFRDYPNLKYAISLRRPQEVIFSNIFLKCISMSLFFQYRLHVDMKVNM